MKAVEYESVITDSGHISLPREIADEIPVGEHLRVVVMWETSTAGPEWRSAGRQAFEAAYCPDGAVFDELIDDAASR